MTTLLAALALMTGPVRALDAALGEPPLKASEPMAGRTGPVDVQPQPNGSLKIVGNPGVVSGTGCAVNRASQMFLCRRGQSQ